MTANWPIDIGALGPSCCGALVYRHRQALQATLVVKATFTLRHEQPAALTTPVDVVRADAHLEGDPRRSVEASSDLAPYLARAGVTLIGSAHAPAGAPVPSQRVRLSLWAQDQAARHRVLLDKSLVVVGDRAAPDAPPRPFQRMPLRYEQAFGGPTIDDNPVGVGAAPGSALPNVVHPTDPRRPASFAPIAASWPCRARAGRPPEPAPGRVLELPDAFDWASLCSAPADQLTDFLQGDEWLLLEGLHPTLPRLTTRLPSARAAARLYRLTAAGWEVIGAPPLLADTLTIDADRQRCSVVWRGTFPVRDGEASLPALRVVAGVELPGAPLTFPDPKSLEVRRPEPAVVAAPPVKAPQASPSAATVGVSAATVALPAATVGLSDDAQAVLGRAAALMFEKAAAAGKSTPAAPATPPAGAKRDVGAATVALHVGAQDDLARIRAMPFKDGSSSATPSAAPAAGGSANRVALQEDMQAALAARFAATVARNPTPPAAPAGPAGSAGAASTLSLHAEAQAQLARAAAIPFKDGPPTIAAAPPATPLDARQSGSTLNLGEDHQAALAQRVAVPFGSVAPAQVAARPQPEEPPPAAEPPPPAPAPPATAAPPAAPPAKPPPPKDPSKLYAPQAPQPVAPKPPPAHLDPPVFSAELRRGIYDKFKR